MSNAGPVGKESSGVRRPDAFFVVATIVVVAVVVAGVVLLSAHRSVPTGIAVAGLVAAGLAILWASWSFDEVDEAAGRKITRRAAGAFAITLATMIGAGWLNGYIGPGTKKPDGITDISRQAPEALAYAQSLEYADDHGSVDEQWLDVKDPATRQIDSVIGPRARIYPESNSHRNWRRDLEGTGIGKGRVVARMQVEADTRRGGAGYPKLGLPVGTSYLWIDSLTGKGDSVAIRAFVIHSGGVTRVENAFFRKYGKHWSSHSKAHWQFDPNDVCICEDCVTHGHCTVCGTFGI